MLWLNDLARYEPEKRKGFGDFVNRPNGFA
jgi:hypothetical protein